MIAINCPPRINCVEVHKDLKLSMEWDLGSGSVPQVFVLQTGRPGFHPQIPCKTAKCGGVYLQLQH